MSDILELPATFTAVPDENRKAWVETSPRRPLTDAPTRKDRTMKPTLTADAELAAPEAPETAIALTQSQRDELAELARQTFEAAEGDSNDEEIEALQEFRDVALDVLGIETDED